VLELDARDVALHFGHQDGGELVRKLYGHPDAALARERVREAFRQAPSAPVPSSCGRRWSHDAGLTSSGTTFRLKRGIRLAQPHLSVW
jgi:hypothetical protein